ncbi:RNA-binding protein [bacterium]|nr:RNA-binding protein [bacterium]
MHGSKLYVGNLNYAVTSEQLKELFAKYGEVAKIDLIQGKGFAFIEMATPEAAGKAKTELSETDFEGRKLRIDEARPPKSRSFSPAGGGYNSGGRGGYGPSRGGYNSKRGGHRRDNRRTRGTRDRGGY